MNKKTFIFFPASDRDIFQNTVACWMCFLSLNTSGGWQSDEIEVVAFSSTEDIEQIWNRGEKLDFVQVIVVEKCNHFHRTVNDLGFPIIAVGTKKINIKEYVFYPTGIASRSIVLFDSIIPENLSAEIHRKLSELQLFNLTFFDNDSYFDMVNTGDYGCISVKHQRNNVNNNLLFRITSLYDNCEENALAVTSVDDVIKKINIYLPEKDKFECNKGRRLHSFPMAYLPINIEDKK